jgi:hypothetical protein
MEIMSQAAVNKMSFDTTILCTVIEVLDDVKYKVRYGDANFIAYVTNGYKYKPNE